MRIILNIILAKQKGMGGFNVAVNFFNTSREDRNNEWFYFVSTVFDEEVRGIEHGLDSAHYFVFHPQPNVLYYFKEGKRIHQIEEKIQPDVIYSILAPSYHRFKTVEVMRCANAWTVKGGVNKYAWKVTPLKYKIRYFIKARITRLLMRNTKFFITQSNMAKKCILRTVHTFPENVWVVSNVLSAKYQKKSVIKTPHAGYNMVYTSSPSVHKDYLLLPEVAHILKRTYKMNGFIIHITIPNYALSAFNRMIKKYDVENCFQNHGYLSFEDLTQLYSQCDMGLFPSLLETFSATLLEYMYYELPIIASNLEFNREITENAALYFHPHDAEDMAAKIFQVYSSDSLSAKLIKAGKSRLRLYTNNAEKFNETLHFLERVVRHA